MNLMEWLLSVCIIDRLSFSSNLRPRHCRMETRIPGSQDLIGILVALIARSVFRQIRTDNKFSMKEIFVDEKIFPCPHAIDSA